MNSKYKVTTCINTKTKKSLFMHVFGYLALISMSFYAIPVYAIVDLIPKNEIKEIDTTATFESASNITPDGKYEISGTKETGPIFTQLDEQVEVLEEIVEKRDLSTKHFWMSDGTIAASSYSGVIHTEDENGNLIDIDNSLKEDENGNLVNNKSTSDYEITFFNDNESIFELTRNDKSEYALSFKLLNERSEKTKRNLSKIPKEKSFSEKEMSKLKTKEKNSKLTKKEKKEKLNLENDIKMETKNISDSVIYKDVLTGTDIIYINTPEKIKENIILKNSKAIQENYIYEYKIENLSKLNIEIKENIIYVFEKEEIDLNNYIYKISAPYMIDSNGEISYDIKLEVTDVNENDNTFKLSMTPDLKWLKEKGRIFPVTIDPEVTTSDNRMNINDTYIYSGDTNNTTRGQGAWERVGSIGTPIRSLIKINDLPKLEAGDQVVHAYMRLTSYPSGQNGYNHPTSAINVSIHKMLKAWDEHTVNWSQISAASNYENASDYAEWTYSANGKWDFDITGAVKGWYTTDNNYGIMIKEVTEVNSNREIWFYSTDVSDTYQQYRPRVVIKYINQAGLEGYQTYKTMNAGRAGTVYTNNYNGNLVLEHHDLSTPGNLLPAKITHYYNTNDVRDKINIGYGIGFRLNFSQTITVNGSEIKYTDEDGTRHYFVNNKDDSGLGLELSLASNIYTIKDKGGNKSTFEKQPGSSANVWHLTKITDNNGNEIKITRTATNYNLIEKVTDAAADALTFTYANGMLSKITDKASRSINYEYTNSNLVKITYPDSEISTYEYSINLLTKIKNINNSYYSFEYYSDLASKIKSIKEYSTSAALGQSLTITYGSYATHFLDNLNHKVSYIFNFGGHTTSIFDKGNNSTSTNNDFLDGYAKNYRYDSNVKNSLIAEDNMIKPIINNVPNSGFENDNTWGLFGNSGTAITCNRRSNEQKINGGYSAKCISNATSGQPGLIQTVTVPKGNVYTLSAWIKTSGIVPSAAGNGAALQAKYNNASNQTVYLGTEAIIGTTDWQRISMTFEYPANATNSLQIAVILGYGSGTVYFDNVQLEYGDFMNQYNFVSNGGFDLGTTGYAISAGTTNDAVITGGVNNKFFQFEGLSTNRKNIYQTIPVSGVAGDIFNVSFNAMHNGVKDRGGI